MERQRLLDAPAKGAYTGESQHVVYDGEWTAMFHLAFNKMAAVVQNKMAAGWNL
jgi:hypothetical protein